MQEGGGGITLYMYVTTQEHSKHISKSVTGGVIEELSNQCLIIKRFTSCN